MSEVFTVKSGSGEVKLDTKKQYLITVPEGEYGYIKGAIQSSSNWYGYDYTDDTIIFDVKSFDPNIYSVKIVNFDPCTIDPSPNKDVGSYIILTETDSKGGQNIVSGVVLHADPLDGEAKNLKGGNQDFSNTIALKTPDGKIHRISNPILVDKLNTHESTPESLTKISRSALYGNGTQLSEELVKDILALQNALGGDEATTLEALKATLAGAKAKAESPALPPQ